MKYMSIFFTILLIWIAVIVIALARQEEESTFILFLITLASTFVLFLIGFAKK